MKEYFIQFKPFLIFLIKFAASYLVLAFVYQSYLNQYNERAFEVDGFTKLVANQSQKILSFFDEHSYTKPNFKEASVKLYYYNQWVSRIVEGCNGLSVIILFISFVIAFKGKLKQTIAFILIGSLVIYVFNVIRIALLCMAIYHFPQYESILHGVIFPLIIYGMVFVLWIIWINNYSFYAKKTS
ncbi:MAG: exosortase family protein XrtF [Flavobacterium sp.]